MVGRAAPAKRPDEQTAERPAAGSRAPDWLVASLGLALWLFCWAILLLMVVGSIDKQPAGEAAEAEPEWLRQ